MSEQKFSANVETQDKKLIITIPFDPDAVWGQKLRHYVTGNVNECTIRGLLNGTNETFFVALGNAWLRGTSIKPGDTVDVMLMPEGPQLDTVADDIAEALKSQADALRFFNSLATFYRKNFIEWVEGAKKAETRQRRIVEMIELLNAGKRQK